MKDDRQKCIEAGASDYLAKPVGSEQLLSMLRVWLLPPRRTRPTTRSPGGRRPSSRPSGPVARGSACGPGTEIAPGRDGQTPGRSSTRRETAWSPSAKVNVLLVDDQPSNLLALEAILGGDGPEPGPGPLRRGGA